MAQSHSKHSNDNYITSNFFSFKRVICSSIIKVYLFLKKAISIDPKWSKAYLWKGKALFHLQQLEEAKATFLQGLELDPDNQLLIKNVEECNLLLRQSGKFRNLKGINKFRITFLCCSLRS
jgi:tetratricopeptide (TPR) repeat protein